MSERIASLNERVLRAIQAVDAAQQEIDRRIEGTRAVIEDERVALAWLKHKVDCSVPSKRQQLNKCSLMSSAVFMPDRAIQGTDQCFPVSNH